MTATTAREITQPGVYDLTSVEYHADPVPGGSLSSTGARKLLPPSCPALFDYQRRNPPASTKAFDFGHAAHDKLLGAGPEIVVVDAPDWRTDRAKKQRDDARAKGAVPLLRHEYQRVIDMADALHHNPVASRLLSPEYGTAEASLFWTDERTGVNRRARLDVLPHPHTGRMVIPDYKSAVSAEPEKFAKAAVDHGYHCQAPYYTDAVRALDLADDPAFVFVVQEKEPPYLVSVIQLDTPALLIGAALNRRAINIYAECTRTGVWPGYANDVALVSLPAWYERRHEEDTTL